MNTGFALAALFSLIATAVHLFVGGRLAARPLIAAPGLDPAVRWQAYFGWHAASVAQIAMTAGFAMAALGRVSSDVALLFTLMAAVFSPLAVWVSLKGGIAPWRFPAVWLFAAVAVLGVFGFGQISGARHAQSTPVAADPLVQP